VSTGGYQNKDESRVHYASGKSESVAHTLTLEYQLHAGWIAPFIHGLQQGIPVARRCTDCAKVSFPPVRVCSCNCPHGEWTELSGSAEIVHRTEGTDGSFALVQFRGVDTQSVVRLDNVNSTTTTVQLRACTTDQPALIVQPRELTNSND